MVDDGTITSDQKAAIEAKLAELKEERESNRDEMKDLTPEERKAKHEEHRTELESWASEQGLDLSDLKGIFMGGRKGGMGPHGMR
ncbi:hypothetical protein KC973_01015 [Candidatus Saccharibacteria bacterium]|nr:hypothetical protein [Candidatus Saccharibacteria bacterium]